MQWTNFDPTITKPTAAVNHVTLSPRGEFYLNYGAMMNLGYPAAVRLMFEKDERLIGIAAAPLNAKASYELRSKYGSDVTSRIFRATSFCRHLGILPDRTIMFRDPKIENGVLVLDLKTTVYAPRRAAPPDPRYRERRRDEIDERDLSRQDLPHGDSEATG